jgi:hypothetical protein
MIFERARAGEGEITLLSRKAFAVQTHFETNPNLVYSHTLLLFDFALLLPSPPVASVLAFSFHPEGRSRFFLRLDGFLDNESSKNMKFLRPRSPIIEWKDVSLSAKASHSKASEAWASGIEIKFSCRFSGDDEAG